MIFTKLSGGICDSYYAIDQENATVAVIEIHYTNSSKQMVSDYTSAFNSAARGSYDVLAVEALKKYEVITKKDWNDVKKDFTDFIKYLEVFKD